MKNQEALNAVTGLTVRNLEGEPVSMDGLWADRRVVLVFLRHFG